MRNFKAEREWVKHVRSGQLDEAYRIYLSQNPNFLYLKHITLRVMCAHISLFISLLISKINPKVDSEDNAVDLSDEFLIFWKCPDVMGRLLITTIGLHVLQTKRVPIRALAWYAHWLVFQGRYKEALVLFKFSLKNVPKESRLHGEILSLLGNYFYSRGKLETSIRIHEKSNNILHSHNDIFFQMFNLGTSAKVYAELGSLESFNKNILASYDYLDPKEPDERYGMRVLIYSAYLNLTSGNNELGKQFYLSAEKSFQKSGSPLDKSIYCIYKSVILLFFRDLNGARETIDQANKYLEQYGHYKSYKDLIISLKRYLTTGNLSLRITQNLLSKWTAVASLESM